MLDELGRFWAGRAFGTNVGNLSAEIYSEEKSGLLRFMDSETGVVVFDLYDIRYSDGELQAKGRARSEGAQVEYGILTIVGRLAADGTLGGKWETTVGTGGTFILHPHGNVLMPKQGQDRPQIEQLFTAERKFGSIRLTSNQLRQLADRIKADFAVGKVVVTYNSGSTQVVRYFDEIRESLNMLNRARYLKLTIQEPVTQNLSKVLVLEFDAESENLVRTQSVDESWAIGAAEKVAEAVKKSEQKLVNLYRRQGLNVNSVIFLLLLVLMPEISSVWFRAGFMLVVLVLLFLNYAIHKRAVPHFLLLSDHLGDRQNSFWGAAISWTSAVTSGLSPVLWTVG